MVYGDVALEGLPHWTKQQYVAYFDLEYDKLILHVVTICAVAICGWEHMLLFGAELRTWRLLFAGRWMPARVAVLLARYAVIAATGMTLYFFFGRPQNCDAVFTSIYALYVVLWAACASIFLMRLQIIYEGNVKVLSAFVALWLGSIGVWIFVVTKGYKAMVMPEFLQLPHQARCAPGNIPAWAAMGWGVSVIFDSAVLFATWRALQAFKETNSRHSLRSREWIWLSNLAYFSTSTFFNISCLLAEVLVHNRVLSHLPAPCAFVLHTVVASRLVLASKGWANGGFLEEDWELGRQAQGQRNDSTRPVVAPPVHSITFDVATERTIEYLPRSASADCSLASQGRYDYSRGPLSVASSHLYGLSAGPEGHSANSFASSDVCGGAMAVNPSLPAPLTPEDQVATSAQSAEAEHIVHIPSYLETREQDLSSGMQSLGDGQATRPAYQTAHHCRYPPGSRGPPA